MKNLLVEKCLLKCLEPGLSEHKIEYSVFEDISEVYSFPESEYLVVGPQTKLVASEFEAMPKLKKVLVAGGGVDNIDEAVAEDKNIERRCFVANGPSTTELTIYFLIHLAKELHKGRVKFESDDWNNFPGFGHDLYGKTLGLVGFGYIGKSVAGVAQALQVNVIAHDPYVQDHDFEKTNVSKVELDVLLENSDFVSLHIPYKRKLVKFFNKEKFKKMKLGSCLVNTSRGQIIDENDLLEALGDGRPKFCALDVFCDEPLPADSPFMDHPQVLSTPHIAGRTIDSQSRMGEMLLKNILQLFE